MPTPLIGLLSDTHGRVANTAAAVRALRERGATMLIHLGDVGSEAVLEELVGIETHLVFGNCDPDHEELGRHAVRLGLHVHHPLGRIEVAGKRIAFSHGHLPHLLDFASREGADYLLHGHTHEQRDERRGAERIINPGALHRAVCYTCALLDPVKDTVEFIEVMRD